jgi:hypothetical protein
MTVDPGLRGEEEHLAACHFALTGTTDRGSVTEPVPQDP